MKSTLRRIANVVLSKSEYGVSDTVASVVNYAIDSFFAKSAKSDPTDKISLEFLGCRWAETYQHEVKFPLIFKDKIANGLNLLITQGSWVNCTNSIDTNDTAFNRISHYTAHTGPSDEPVLAQAGTYFLTTPDGAPLVVQFDFGVYNFICQFQVFCNKKFSKLSEMFMQDFMMFMQANDIYHRQCLTFKDGSLSFNEITPTSVDSVVLDESIKKKILENSVGVVNSADRLIDLGLCPSRNTLLISPPGMAKSTLFRAISCELEGKATRIWCTGKSIQSPESVNSLFQAARELSPCVVFIEDMDLFGGDRSQSHDSVILNEFLSCLDGQTENTGVVILASTNDLRSMDEALVNRPGRFDLKIEIPVPTKTERDTLLRMFLDKYHTVGDISITRDLWDSVLDMTEGMTGAYIHELAKSIVMSCYNSQNHSQYSGICVFSSTHLSECVEQILESWKLGQTAKKHHTAVV